ncbi:hypothetical protein BD289DRAFT_419970 [Coniella lustricola]|uniref:Inner centromere protein ARK-binding domain-containing protein n=1 Tax=Coniella lustricola TaxID=2025994 RepID=A0A2T3ANR9_9PEZI|nr:hypothetical protein BD289DRAFT_419970 [Coniella lustricola]
MAMRSSARPPVGSTAWCADERSSALSIAQSEVEEFAYSASNEVEWLNEHMADIFSENQIHVAEIFKTPGKLRGKTPRTIRKQAHKDNNRVPLSNIFSAKTPQSKGFLDLFTSANLLRPQDTDFRIAEDSPGRLAQPAQITRKPVASTQASPERTAADSRDSGRQTRDDAVHVVEPVAERATPPVDETSDNIHSQQTTTPVGSPQEYRQAWAGSAATPADASPKSIDGLPETASQPTKQENGGISSYTPREPPPEANFDVPENPVSSPIQLLDDGSRQSSAHVSPVRPQPVESRKETPGHDVSAEPAASADAASDTNAEVPKSPSEGSSPIRPFVRKSSLNFASLPAREPLTSNKSIGSRMSRTSHFDASRSSYYPRHTEGKSLGARHGVPEVHDDDAMDIDNEEQVTAMVIHDKDVTSITESKTYTQRLQDQISMLGKSQMGGTRPTKPVANFNSTQSTVNTIQAQAPQPIQPIAEGFASPSKSHLSARTPGAFSGHGEDDWIIPPTRPQPVTQSPHTLLRTTLATSLSEESHTTTTPSRKNTGPAITQPQPASPGLAYRSPEKVPLSKQIRPLLHHGKSSSVPDLTRSDIFGSRSNPFTRKDKGDVFGDAPARPQSLVDDGSPFKYNTLQHFKNKFSSILKGAKDLSENTAAILTDAKDLSNDSPSVAGSRKQRSAPSEALNGDDKEETLYPDRAKDTLSESHQTRSFAEISLEDTSNTGVLAERERRAQEQKKKKAKEAQDLAYQIRRLEQARLKREKEGEVLNETQSTEQIDHQNAFRTPAPKVTNRSGRTSPQKSRPPSADEDKIANGAGVSGQDEGSADATATTKIVPASIPRPTPGQSLKSREIKRPMKPTRETLARPKQVPTLIHVNTSSQRPGYHSSNTALANNTQDVTSNSQQQQLASKASQSSVQTKSSLQSLKGSNTSATVRPKALELADRRRQEEERKAQRRREMKADMERKREADRKVEEERRDRERQRIAAEEEAKKQAARQAVIEKAKKTRAPPPAVRPQLNSGASDLNTTREKVPVSRPQSRLQQTATHRSQEDLNRPVNAVLAGVSKKLSMKRPLQADGTDDAPQRNANNRTGATQQKEVKRLRLSDEFNAEEEMEIQSYGGTIKGPPVRPSAGLKKGQSKTSFLSTGYTAVAHQGVTRDIFKASAGTLHNKNGHPLDMAQISKGPIPFASSTAGPSHKTPARATGAKIAAMSAKRSSPRFQNGENIELPEIQSDDDDNDDDDDDGGKGLGIASWADTPELRRELMKQESIDPLQVFGPPAPLKLEEVFKNKDRWSKFRSRGSSANWNGGDKLTEDEIRKDLAAREKMRRDGGWTYELSRDIQ